MRAGAPPLPRVPPGVAARFPQLPRLGGPDIPARRRERRKGLQIPGGPRNTTPGPEGTGGPTGRRGVPPPSVARRHAGRPRPPGLASHLRVTCAVQGRLAVVCQSGVRGAISARRGSRGGIWLAGGAARAPKNGRKIEGSHARPVYAAPARAGGNGQTRRTGGSSRRTASNAYTTAEGAPVRARI